MSADTYALLTAFGLTALPVATGALFGGLLRRQLPLTPSSRKWRWTGAAILALPLAAALGVERIGLWDSVSTLLLFVAGFAILLHASSNREGCSRLLLVAASGGLALMVAEKLLVGVFEMRPMPPTPITAFASLTAPGLDPACAATYETDYGVASRLPGGQQHDQRPFVLHLGDSMVYGTGVGGPRGAFPLRLGQSDPKRRHVNAGFWGSATDGQWLALRSWAKTVEAEMVVHYLFLGNDIHEIDRPSLCCGMQPLVIYGETPRPRCETAVYRVPFRERLETSPAPYMVRALAHRSALATQLVRGFERLGATLARSGIAGGQRHGAYESDGDSFSQFEKLEHALRNEAESMGAKFVVVLLVPRQLVSVALGREPVGPDMWRGKGMSALSRIRAILREGGYDVIETFDFVKSLVEDPDLETWFANDCPGDFHFSELGHARFAEWIWPQLRSRLEAVQSHP